MKIQKILYFANGNSIHDVKWISFFSSQKDRFLCYLLCDTLCVISEQTRLDLSLQNIQLIDQIEPFSITSPLRTLRSIKHFKKLIKEIEPDLIHVLFAAPNALWLNFAKIPSIITMRGSDILIVIPDLLVQKGLKKLYFGILFRLFKKSFLNAKVITGTSWAQLEKAEDLFEGLNLQLVRTGVDVLKISEIDQVDKIPECLKEKEFVFSPRFMSPIYNIELQINAIALLNNEILSRYVFVFIRGKQFDQDYYQNQVLKLNYLREKKQINFVVFDYLDQASMWMFYKKASLCIMTPISDGTPNSALEAMAAKCPLIVSNLEYDADLFSETCLKLDNFEVESLVSLIENALNHYPNTLIEKGFSQVYSFGNREKEMSKLANIYKEI